MRIIVCGGREYDDFDAVRRVLAPLGSSTTIVHGAARGADSLAGRAAHQLGFAVDSFPADWDTFGKAAGFVRNQQMLDAGTDLVIAFPGGRGTDDMVLRARKAGVIVLRVYA